MSLFANYLSHKFSLTVKSKSCYRGGSCRFPEETKKIITIFNYSNLNTQHKSNRSKLKKKQPKIIHQKRKIPKTIM